MDAGPGCRAGRWEAAGGDRSTWPVVWTPPPRGIGGTLPGWVLRMWNVETPSVDRTGWSGGLTVRKADLPGGTGWPKKPMPVAERQQETASCGVALLWAAGRG